MRRSTRFALMLAAVLTAASPARAQYGYGGGWGGWGAFDARQQHGPRAGHDGHGSRHVQQEHSTGAIDQC